MLTRCLCVPGGTCGVGGFIVQDTLLGDLWLSVSQLLLRAIPIPQTRIWKEEKLGKGHKGAGGACRLSLLPPICPVSLFPAVSRVTFSREWISDHLPVWRKQSGAVILFYWILKQISKVYIDILAQLVCEWPNMQGKLFKYLLLAQSPEHHEVLLRPEQRNIQN